MPNDHGTRRAVRRNLWHDPKTMKGTIALVVLALCATWAFLFLPLTKPSAPRDKPAASAHDATPTPPQAAVPVRTKPAPDAPSEPHAAVTPVPQQPATNRAVSAMPSGQGNVVVIGGEEPKSSASSTSSTPRSVTQLAQPLGELVDFREPSGELGEGILSPDYRILEESYIKEARDGRWAQLLEMRVRNILIAGGLGPRIVLIHCQTSVCRVQMEPHGSDPYGELLTVPGLAAALGIDSATPYSLNNAELVVYARPELPPELQK